MVARAGSTSRLAVCAGASPARGTVLQQYDRAEARVTVVILVRDKE